ncbi:Purine catabolism protein PucB [Anatilimnocola aggregata]|uniref:Purine catabolism protein PucB n=1 Tax=Anatilimnocola aggregata TaxID=2528021 RepID=A0A517Y828_9BACT|nr:nucleotidyltransferase family protein [Anatilimnocola aggregata]QDU26376.1 Purine catabolism protein PucB [Anatilimnocola aggregata]
MREEPNHLRAFAIIPAAGESRRMGEPKLLLPLQSKPLIAHTIDAWLTAGLKPLVVVRPNDEALVQVCRERGADVLQPQAPPSEMKVSVQLALQFLDGQFHPGEHDCWLIAPADMPRLSVAIIGRLLQLHCESVASHSTSILVPTIAGKHGHPVLFPWPLSAQVHQLGTNEGVKALLTRNPVREIPCDDLLAQGPQAFADIDTPADYQRFK